MQREILLKLGRKKQDYLKRSEHFFKALLKAQDRLFECKTQLKQTTSVFFVTLKLITSICRLPGKQKELVRLRGPDDKHRR